MHCIVASTSTIYGSGYLEYLREPLENLFKNIGEILFIPYARPSGIGHDEYTEIAEKGLAFICKNVVGIHEKGNPREAIQNAEAIFTGGGNTFLLVKQLYDHHIMDMLKRKIETGAPYLGTSAGSNICGQSMQTTNDMPIVFPPTYKTLGILPFNINAHYLDPDPGSKHKGETRETRIREFHKFNDIPVVGLREGSWLEVENEDVILRGGFSARVFEPGKHPLEIATGSRDWGE